MPVIQPYSELRGMLSAVRDILSNASGTLSALRDLQTTMEGQNADTTLIYNVLRPRYDTLSDTLREAAQELLAATVRPEIHCKVGWPSSYTTNVIVTSAAAPAVDDKVTATGLPFGGLASGDTIEVITAEDAANERTLHVDDTPGGDNIDSGFKTLTANAADTILELRQRGINASCSADTTKIAATTLATNAFGAGVCTLTGLDGVLCGLSIHRNGAVDEFDVLVISKDPVCVVDGITNTGTVTTAAAAGNGLKDGDLVRFEGLQTAEYATLNGRTVVSSTTSANTFTIAGSWSSGVASLTDDEGIFFRVTSPDRFHLVKKQDMTSQCLSITPGLRLRPTDTLYIGVKSDDTSATADVVAFCV